MDSLAKNGLRQQSLGGSECGQKDIPKQMGQRVLEAPIQHHDFPTDFFTIRTVVVLGLDIEVVLEPVR